MKSKKQNKNKMLKIEKEAETSLLFIMLNWIRQNIGNISDKMIDIAEITIAVLPNESAP